MVGSGYVSRRVFFRLSSLFSKITIWIRVSNSLKTYPDNWSQTFQFTTVLPEPETPVLLYPENNDNDVSRDSVTFKWEYQPNAEFTLQIAGNNAFFQPWEKTSANPFGEKWEIPQVGKTYYWRVIAKNESGVKTSPVYNFSAAPLVVPSKPILISPTSGSENLALPISLKWKGVGEVDSFKIEVARDSLFNSIETQVAMTDTLLALQNIEKGEKYFWRVWSKNEAGTSPWSEIGDFTVAPPLPTKPELIASEESFPSVYFGWYSQDYVTFYQLEISPNPDFSDSVATYENITDTIFSVSGLEVGWLYHWRVKAINSTGESPWSNTKTFLLENPTGLFSIDQKQKMLLPLPMGILNNNFHNGIRVDGRRNTE